DEVIRQLGGQERKVRLDPASHLRDDRLHITGHVHRPYNVPTDRVVVRTQRPANSWVSRPIVTGATGRYLQVSLARPISGDAMHISLLPDERALTNPTAPCISDDTISLDNASFCARVHRAADVLASHGVGPDDVVATILANRIELVVT